METLRDKYPFTHRVAVRPLDVIIVGAGITGLSTALALTRTGHSVTVFESASTISEIGAGIQIPPNASRILNRLGVLEELLKYMSLLGKVNIYRYDSDNEIGSSPLMPELGHRCGAPMGVIHRADLQRVLLQSALKHGCRILTCHRVLEADPSFSPRVLVLDSRTGVTRWCNANIVIAADGIRSTLRKQMAKAIQFHDVPVPTGDAAYRLLIPRKTIQHNQALLELMDQNVARRYMGPGGHVMAYPLAGNTIYNLVLVHPDGNSVNVKDKDCWTSKGSRADMLGFYGSWSPVIRTWISHSDEPILEWSLVTYKPLPSWVQGSIALAGDACHPMLPYVAQGAANGMEDALALATVFTHTDNVPLGLSVYQSVRKNRAEQIAASAASTGENLHLPDGPEQRKRDEQIRRTDGDGESKDRWRDRQWQDFMWEADVMRDIDDNWDTLANLAHRSRL